MRLFPTDTGRERMVRSLGLAMLLAIAPTWATTTVNSPAPPAQHSNAQDAAHDHDDDNVAPLPWNRLDATQQSILAPIRSSWDQLPPQRQQHLAAHAEHWSQLPPDRLAQIRQHLAHWAQMTPEQRRDAWHGEDAFRSMSAADRQRVLDAYEKFKALSPEERRALMKRFREEHGKHHDDQDAPDRAERPRSPSS